MRLGTKVEYLGAPKFYLPASFFCPRPRGQNLNLPTYLPTRVGAHATRPQARFNLKQVKFERTQDLGEAHYFPKDLAILLFCTSPP